MNNLKTLRELNGLKQAALARELDIKNQASISEWETGRKSLSVENAIMFAHFFGVSVGCVVGTEPIPEGYPENYTRPIFYSELIREHQKAAEEGRLYKPPKKPPFNKEQIEYLDQWGDRLTEKIVDSLREDTSLLRETGPEAN